MKYISIDKNSIEVYSTILLFNFKNGNNIRIERS